MMDCLVTIENAMKTYNLLSLHMPESHWGGVTLSYNCNQQGNIMLVDSTILSCCLFLCIFWKVTEYVFITWYPKDIEEYLILKAYITRVFCLVLQNKFALFRLAGGPWVGDLSNRDVLIFWNDFWRILYETGRGAVKTN